MEADPAEAKKDNAVPHSNYDPTLGRQLMSLCDELEQTLNKLSRVDTWDCKHVNNAVLREAIGFLPHDEEILDQSRDTLVRTIAHVKSMITIAKAMVNHGNIVRFYRLRSLLRRVTGLHALLRRP